MTEAEQLHTLTVPYPPYEAKRAMTCISVSDFETYEPVDFRDFLPKDRALQEFQAFSVAVTRQILSSRKESFGESHPIPNMDNIASFLGSLAIRPFGILSFVDNLTLFGEPIQSPGVTSSMHRQSFIIKDNIKSHEGGPAASYSDLLSSALEENAYVESIGVHELVHLAGTPDIAYFIADKTRERTIRGLKFSPMNLEQPAKVDMGGFYEEGFATLVAYMYLWKQDPKIMSDPRVELRKSPSGVEVSLPIRHAFYTNTYAYMAWTLERLTDFSPQIWDTLKESRNYSSSPNKARGALKSQVDKLGPNLFELMDTTDIKDLDQVMKASATIDAIVKHKTGR